MLTSNFAPPPVNPVYRWTAIAVLVLTAATGCRHGAAATSATTSAQPTATIRTGPMLSLTVRPEDTGAHYNRDEWGGWTPRGGGCDTRETVLRRAGLNIQLGPNCRVTSGTWISAYDGIELHTPAQVQIDHIVPVREAARSGARTWTRKRRAEFYNDLANLIAVSAASNTAKGDRDPARWLPPKTQARCDYAQIYIATKARYGLTVDQAEHDALAHVLDTNCPRHDLQDGAR